MICQKKIDALDFRSVSKKSFAKEFCLLGVGRMDFTDESFREKMSLNVKIFVKPKPVNQKQLPVICKACLLPGDGFQ